MTNTFFYHRGWRFRTADAFPMDAAMRKLKDPEGREVYDPGYDDSGWEEVVLPHTFNGADLFSVPIEDGGSGQKRTAAFYRNTLEIPPEQRGKRVFLSFEGVRQTCYLYADGHLAGYRETGVGPFGFELTPFLREDGVHCITVATDNTSTRNIPFCIAETPNAPGVLPGSYLQSQEEKVPAEREGVGFEWNCNDFNPVLGGLSHPVRIHFKNDVYLTLPLYANLRTKGIYVHADGFDLERGALRIHVEAEVRNMRPVPARCRITVRVMTGEGAPAAEFTSEETEIRSMAELDGEPPVLTLTPPDAYIRDGEGDHRIPAAEDAVLPTVTASYCTEVIRASARLEGIGFWTPSDPRLYRVCVTLTADGKVTDEETVETGFRQTAYDKDRGLLINGKPVFLRGYAQRAANEWAQSGIVPQWLHDADARLIRESGANHIRVMHVAACPEDLRSYDRWGIVCTQPAGDKEKEAFGRQWDQRVELMRDVIIACRNHPSIIFWEAGNNVISAEHMREMRLLREELDPHGGRFMGCRTINTKDALLESEYVGTMLNRHAARFLAEHGPVTETEYSREEAPRRVWDDYSPPDFDYRCRYLGKGGRKQKGLDFYDLTSEELALANARGYSEFFHDRIGGASGKDLYSACAALCWTDSAQHGRQSWSENGRMSGRVDAMRVKKQSFDVFRVMHSVAPRVRILGHWNYPPEDGKNYRAPEKRFNGSWWEETGKSVYRDPKHKTVYCIGSYAVAEVLLRINGKNAGSCGRPEAGFVFPFPDIDVTQSGVIEAVGLDAEGCPVCSDRIETALAPAAIRLTPVTAPGGWRADGRDLAAVDVEIVDAEGRVCPLDDRLIRFRTEGPAVFLGGYNSGRFNGNGRNDSVIRKPFVYAECGMNRVLLRAAEESGEIRLTALAEGLPEAGVTLRTVPADLRKLTDAEEASVRPEHGELPGPEEDFFTPLPWADRLKYTPEKENYCKILVNGQEPDFRGVRAVNRSGSVWGNILCVLERIRQAAPDKLDFTWEPDSGIMTLDSMGHHSVIRTGETHLVTDGKESLMDGQPYVTPEGIPVMEVSAAIQCIRGATAQLDERIGALRITV